MPLLLLLLVLFAVGGGAAYYLRADNGYVLLSYGHWMLETSVVGFIGALFVVVLLLVLLLRLFGASFRLPRNVRGALARRRLKHEHEALSKGLLLWLAGRDERAEVTLQKHLPEDGAAAAPHHLLAATAASRQQEHARAQHYLRRAAETDTAFGNEAIARMQAQSARDAQDLAAARRALESLRDRSPSHPRVYPDLITVMLAQRDWQAALELLRTTQKVRGWLPEQWMDCLRSAMFGALQDAQRIEDARQIWAQAPAVAREAHDIEAHYAEALLRLNAETEFMRVIHKALERRWAPELVQLFLRAEPPDIVAALASVEQWLQRHGEQPELLLAAAQTCRRNRLWGKARSYLDALMRQQPRDPAARFEYGQLCLAVQQPEEARAHFEEGLKQALKPA